MPNIFTFSTTSEAYDATQCRDDIGDGDVLLIPSEGVAGYLMRAWPIAVTPKCGAFHMLKEGADHGAEYDASVALALAEAAKFGTAREWVIALVSDDAYIAPVAIRYQTIDGIDTQYAFENIELARVWVQQQMGPCEIGSTYAVTGDGIAKATIIRGATLREIFGEG